MSRVVRTNVLLLIIIGNNVRNVIKFNDVNCKVYEMQTNQKCLRDGYVLNENWREVLFKWVVILSKDVPGILENLVALVVVDVM